MKIRLLATLVVFLFPILGIAQQYTIQYTEDCQTIDLTPQFASDSEHEYLWEFGDGFESTVHNPLPHTYDTGGSYTVCLTVFDAETGLPLNEPNCQLVPVPSCCEPLEASGFSIIYGALITDCVTHTICVQTPIGFDDDDYCITWDFGDGSAWDQGSFSDWDCVSHKFNCNGTFDVCVTLYCCEDPGNVISFCETIEVQCECIEPSGPFAINGVFSDCEYSATLFGGCDDYIVKWVMGDGSFYQGREISHTYWWPGTFDVCVSVECPEQSFPKTVICIEVVNDCDCTVPPDAWAPLIIQPPEGEDVQGVCNTPVFIIESAAFESLEYADGHCFVWDYGDGNIDSTDVYSEFTPLGWSNFGVHSYLCNGTYDVCLTAYCCDDPSIFETWCTQVVIDCPCRLEGGLDSGFPGGGSINPPEIQWLFAPLINMNGCLLEVDLAAMCPLDYCVEWDFGDGTVSSEYALDHVYQQDGIYDVCVTVTCCDDSDMTTQHCFEVTAACEPFCAEDLNGDGVVSTADLLQMLAALGSACN
jgi:uncharacterized protein with GYD domain